MCGLGTWELLIVLAIVVLLFGASRLPQLGKALGETVRNFKKGSSGPEAVKESKEQPAKAVEVHEVAQLVEGEDAEPAKPELAKPEPAEPEPAKPEPAKPEPAKPESS